MNESVTVRGVRISPEFATVTGHSPTHVDRTPSAWAPKRIKSKNSLRRLPHQQAMPMPSTTPATTTTATTSWTTFLPSSSRATSPFDERLRQYWTKYGPSRLRRQLLLIKQAATTPRPGSKQDRYVSPPRFATPAPATMTSLSLRQGKPQRSLNSSRPSTPMPMRSSSGRPRRRSARSTGYATI